MPKWANRAKAAMNNSQNQFQKRSLDDTIAEARGAIEDIQFIVDSSECECEKLELGLNGLSSIESFYRESVRNGKKIALGKENLERLMALVLGQFLVENGSGNWALYEGENYVFNPVVVRLADGRHLDVFLFCCQLSDKAGVRGAGSGDALSNFCGNTERLSFE